MTARPDVPDTPDRTDAIARCVFCAIAAGDAPATMVRPFEYGVGIFEPIGPHAPGHVLVIADRHTTDATEDPLLTGFVFATASRYAAEVGPCNILTSVGAAATQSVPHLHVHVVPRGPMDGLPERWPWLGTDTTDEPAAIAALAATLWERHPDAVLTAGANAGVLREDHKDVCSDCGVDHGNMHPRECAIARGERVLWNPLRRLVTDWREVADG